MKHAAEPDLRGRGLAAFALPSILALAASLSGCTEEIITGAGEDRPGATVETIEVVLMAEELPVWRDTTYTGFRVPADVPFSLVADSTTLRARTLARADDIPETVTVDDEEVSVESFSSATVQLSLDSARSAAPASGFTVRLFSLARGYDPETATWTEAREGQPWSTPGGDLDLELGSVVIDDSIPTRLAEGIDIPLDAPDSVLTSWRESGNEPGFAILVEGGGATRLHVQQVDLEAEAIGEGQEDPTGVNPSVERVTFIFEPETPPPGQNLRVGGLPASRTYLAFRPPDSAETAGVSLRDVRINKAELVLQPTDPPAPAFRPESVLSGTVIQLLADPLEFGPKTPVGSQIGSFSQDLAAAQRGEPLRVPITDRVQAWASADTVETLRVGLLLSAEGGSLRFREFGSVDAPPGSRPMLRLLVTPAADFDL